MKKPINISPALKIYNDVNQALSSIDEMPAIIKLQAELDEVQKRSQTRTISIKNIMEYIMRVENFRIKMEIPKVDFDGCHGWCSPHQTVFPNAYRYEPQGTAFGWSYIKGKYYITNIRRENCNDKANEDICIIFNELVQEHILRNASYLFHRRL